jgi:hypothetical protein
MENGDGVLHRPGALNRRRFLVLGSVGVLAPWFALPARAASLTGLGLTADEPISIGYLDGSEHLEAIEFLPWEYDPEDWRWRIVPASSLPSGDPYLAVDGVRITIQGLYPHRDRVAVEDLPAFAGLTVLVDSDDPTAERPLVYYPWTLERRQALALSQRVSFVLPVHRQEGLALAMEVREAARLAPPRPLGGPRRVTGGAVVPGRGLLRASAFTVDGEGLRPRLVRGIYFLSFYSGVFDRVVDVPQPGSPRGRELVSLVVSVEPVAGP